MRRRELRCDNFLCDPLAADLLAVLPAQHLVHLAQQRLLAHLQQTAALLDVELAQHLIGDLRDALHDVVDGGGLLHRVAFGIRHQ